MFLFPVVIFTSLVMGLFWKFCSKSYPGRSLKSQFSFLWYLSACHLKICNLRSCEKNTLLLRCFKFCWTNSVNTTISEIFVTDLGVNHFKDFEGWKTGVIHGNFCPLLLETTMSLCAVMFYSYQCLLIVISSF